MRRPLLVLALCLLGLLVVPAGVQATESPAATDDETPAATPTTYPPECDEQSQDCETEPAATETETEEEAETEPAATETSTEADDATDTSSSAPVLLIGFVVLVLGVIGFFLFRPSQT